MRDYKEGEKHHAQTQEKYVLPNKALRSVVVHLTVEVFRIIFFIMI